MLKKKQSTLLVAMTLALTACGGGGSSSPTTPPVVTPPVAAAAGKAIDGYLNGSTAYCDVNKNSVLDSGEISVKTDSGGNYNFTAGCASTIVVTGGTDVATGFVFNGTLKTPVGSSVATPLTSLMADSGMTAAQLAKALGLPDGIDVTKIDPLDGKNENLLRVTLATQQLVQQMANMLGGLSGSANLADLYSKVGKALSSALLANAGTPLFSADGSVNNTLMVAAGKGAVTAIAADPAFTKKVTISDADLLAASSQISSQASQFMTADLADLADVTKNLQNPALPPPDANGTSNYLSLASDSVNLNGTPVTYAALQSGVTISSPTTFGLDFVIKGTPTINSVSRLALELKEVGGQGRVLQVMIDKVNIKSVNGQISIVPDATAKVYVYGHTGSGNNINMTLADLTFKPISVVNNSLNLNYKSLVNKVLASSDSTTSTTAQKFVDIKGNFGIKIAVDGLPVRSANGAESLAASTVTVTGTSPLRSVVGLGVAGTLNIQ